MEGTRKFYNTKEDCVKHFMQANPTLFDPSVPNELETFRMMTEEAVAMFDGNAYGWECEKDYDGFVEDFYYQLWKPFVKPMMNGNRMLIDEIAKMKSTETPTIMLQMPAERVIQKP